MKIGMIYAISLLSAGVMHSQAARLAGQWRYHPAACFGTQQPGSQVQKMLSSDRYTYLITRGRLLDRSKAGGHIPLTLECNAIFRADRLHPEKGLYPAIDELKLEPRRVEIAEYSHKARRLVVVYANGAIDIVDDSDNVLKCDVLSKFTLPYDKGVRSVNFDSDGRTMYLALECGYFTIDLLTGAKIAFVESATPIDYINRVGERMVAVAKASDDVSRLFVCDLNKAPDTAVENAKPLTWIVKHTGNCFNTTTQQLVSPQNILPLSDDTFAVAVLHGGSYCVHAVKLDENDALSAVNVFSQTITAIEMGVYGNLCHLFTLDGVVSEYRDGYLFNFNNAVGLLKSGESLDITASDPASDLKARAAHLISKTGLASLPDKENLEAQRKLTSWDGTSFDFYYLYNGIYSRSAQYDAEVWNSTPTWSERLASFAISGNANSLVSSFDYNPKYGLIIRGNPHTVKMASAGSQYDNVTAFADNKWTRFDYFVSNPGLKSVTYGANGGAADPLNPDYIYSSSYQHGIFRHNLADPNDVLVLSRQGDTGMTNVPGFIPVFPTQAAYSTLVNLTEPKFDANGVMWSLYDRVPDSGEENHMWLYFWTPEDRLESFGAVADHSLYDAHPMRRIEIRNGLISSRDCRLLPLLSEGHTSKLLCYYFDYNKADKRYFIYDHRGTLDDTSDDIFYDLTALQLENKGIMALDRSSNYYMFGACEDPVSRKLYILSVKGCFYINLDDLEAGDGRLHQMVLSTEQSSVPVQHLNEFTCMTIDAHGRRWIGSVRGLLCVDSDDTTVLGYYTPDDSGLPGKEIAAIGVNPPDGSIFVATYFDGLAQFFPEGASGHPDARAIVNVTPNEVMPHYLGHLSFSGLSDASDYSIVDDKGETVAALVTSVGGFAQWNQRDASGALVPTGVYFLRSGENNLKEIKVMR